MNNSTHPHNLRSATLDAETPERLVNIFQVLQYIREFSKFPVNSRGLRSILHYLETDLLFITEDLLRHGILHTADDSDSDSKNNSSKDKKKKKKNFFSEIFSDDDYRKYNDPACAIALNPDGTPYKIKPSEHDAPPRK